MQSNHSHTHKFSLARVALASCVCFSLTSCSLTNPYVDDALLVNDQNVTLCPVIPADMAAALQCSATIKSRYIASMGDQANLTAWTGVGLIPLTAFTIGFAASGDSASKISDFALGSAGLYSLSSWLSSPQRTRIFGLGQKAIVCAEKVVQPFIITDSDKTTINQGLAKLAKVYGEVSGALKLVQAAATTLNDGDATKVTAVAYFNKVQASLTQARLVQQKTATLMQQFNTAPGTLSVAVKDINAHVNEALGSTIQSLSALPGILSGMGNLYTDNKSYFSAFAPAEETSATQEGIETQSDSGSSQKNLAMQLLTLLDGLAQKNTELEQATSELHNLLDQYTPKPSSESLQECGIDTSDIGAGISVNPASLSFTEGSDAAQSVSVNGGSGTYVVIANQTYLAIEQTPAFGGLVTIKLNNSEPGNHIVKVKDTTGRVQEFMVSVSPKSGAASSDAANGDTQGDADGGTQSPLCQGEELLAGEADFCKNPTLTETLQQALVEELSLPADFVDNLYGIETRKQVIEMLKRPVFNHLTDDITPVTLQAILDYQYQKANLEQQDIDALVAPLDSGQNTSVEKIMQFQNTQDGLHPTGFIGEQTVEAICAKHQGIGQCG